MRASPRPTLGGRAAARGGEALRTPPAEGRGMPGGCACAGPTGGHSPWVSSRRGGASGRRSQTPRPVSQGGHTRCRGGPGWPGEPVRLRPWTWAVRVPGRAGAGAGAGGTGSLAAPLASLRSSRCPAQVPVRAGEGLGARALGLLGQDLNTQGCHLAGGRRDSRVPSWGLAGTMVLLARGRRPPPAQG